jgi:starvation-inducible DNA-binding protein
MTACYPAGRAQHSETLTLVTIRIYATVETVRDVHDDVADPATADLLHASIDACAR